MEAVTEPSVENSSPYALSLRKRLLDIAGAIIGLGISLPGIALASVAIKLDDGGPISYSQEQSGLNGNIFRMYKLRSMRDALPTDCKGVCEETLYKSPTDPRVTRVGRIIRHISLDETPQFFNVLIGDMSLVGPRPNSPEKHLAIACLIGCTPNDYLATICKVKPGLTGPAQVNGRGELQQNREGIQKRTNLEIDYTQNNSFWGDLKILFQTVGAVISGRGAF